MIEQVQLSSIQDVKKSYNFKLCYNYRNKKNA